MSCGLSWPHVGYPWWARRPAAAPSTSVLVGGGLAPGACARIQHSRDGLKSYRVCRQVNVIPQDAHDPHREVMTSLYDTRPRSQLLRSAFLARPTGTMIVLVSSRVTGQRSAAPILQELQDAYNPRTASVATRCTPVVEIPEGRCSGSTRTPVAHMHAP